MSTTPTPTTSLNPFEKIIFAIVATAASTVPLFVHSTNGMILVNAGENLIAALLAEFQAVPVPPPAA